MEVVNVTEIMVKDLIKNLVEKEDMCKCNQCMNDMYAYALNILPSRYVNSQEGALYSKAYATNPQNYVDIKIAIKKAIEVVKKNPNHTT